MKDIYTVLISVGLSALVSWFISRANMKHTTRLNLYERRMKIYNTCYVAIRETLQSLTFVQPIPVEYFDGNQNLLKELVEAERESVRILSSVHDDILELEKIVHRISLLQHLISAVFIHEPSSEEIKKRQEDVSRYSKELKVLKEKMFSDYRLEGSFMKKLNDAITIKE